MNDVFKSKEQKKYKIRCNENKIQLSLYKIPQHHAS